MVFSRRLDGAAICVLNYHCFVSAYDCFGCGRGRARHALATAIIKAAADDDDQDNNKDAF